MMRLYYFSALNTTAACSARSPVSENFSSRNCLINRSRSYFGVPRASRRGQTSPILPPRASRTPRSGSPPAIYQTVSLGNSHRYLDPSMLQGETPYLEQSSTLPGEGALLYSFSGQVSSIRGKK